MLDARRCALTAIPCCCRNRYDVGVLRNVQSLNQLICCPVQLVGFFLRSAKGLFTVVIGPPQAGDNLPDLGFQAVVLDLRFQAVFATIPSRFARCQFEGRFGWNSGSVSRPSSLATRNATDFDLRMLISVLIASLPRASTKGEMGFWTVASICCCGS